MYVSTAMPSSPSSEELSQEQGDRVSLDAADSGRGSWTSCSSGSHDSIQAMQQGRSWEALAEGAGLWAGRGSWASTSSCSSSSAACWGDESEGDTGTIKRRGGKDVGTDPDTCSITSTGSEESKQQSRRPSPITAGTTKTNLRKTHTHHNSNPRFVFFTFHNTSHSLLVLRFPAQRVKTVDTATPLPLLQATRPCPSLR